MTDTTKQNILVWALGLVTVILAGSVTWVFMISSDVVERRVEIASLAKESDRNRSVVDTLRSDLSDISTSLSKITQLHNTLSVFLGRVEGRQDLHTDRISNHEALGLHHEAGLLINGIKIQFENMSNKITALESESSKGERYTLKMAERDKEMIYREIGNIENNLHSSINDLIELQREVIIKMQSGNKNGGSSIQN